MRSFGIGLAIALILAGTAPTGAFAAAPPTVSKEARTKGMAAAPGLVTAGGLDCNVADARFVGEGAPDPKTKLKTALYELACTGNEGLLIQQTGSNAPTSFTCEQVAEQTAGKAGATDCILPGNADPKAGLLPYVAKSGITCTPDRFRALGQSATQALFEVACKEDNGGYVIQISAPPHLDKPSVASPCLALPENGNVTCTLTPRAKQLAVVDKLVTAAGKTCAIKDDGRRYIGATQSGETLYEVACSDGKGFIIDQGANGATPKAIDCAQADSLAGGCKLTDAREAKTEQAGLYTQLSKKAGFNCDVAGYAVLPGQPSAPTTEVVELKCSNRPDGAIAMFAPSGPSSYADCAHAEIVGYRCALTKPDVGYASLTKDLQSLGKNSCTVSESRMVGVTADKHAYIEVGCSDGLQGYMVEYTPNPITAKSTIICNDAKGIAGGCTLPGNTKKS